MEIEIEMGLFTFTLHSLHEPVTETPNRHQSVRGFMPITNTGQLFVTDRCPARL